MLAHAANRSVLIAAGALLAANVALELRPAKPALVPAAVVVIEPVPAPRGMTIRPPALRDAEPWPRGMVIAPPQTGDRMAIYVPGDDVVSALLAPLLDLLRPAGPKLL